LIFTYRTLSDASSRLFDINFSSRGIKLNRYKCSFTGLNTGWMFISARTPLFRSIK
jgi:hypothetical protein